VKIVLSGNINPPYDWLNKNKINFFPYTSDDEFEIIYNEKQINQRFRNGYWRYTVERLLVISKYHEKFPMEKILQIEVDVILLPNFPIMTFSEIRNLAWLGYGKKADIASILYTPNLESSRRLRFAILEEIRNGNVVDMEILFNVRQHFQVNLLPVSNSNKSEFGSLKSKYFDGDVATYIDQAIFDGVFDSASIGIWLTGQDPRNRFGITKVRTTELIENGSVQIDPSQGSYKLDVVGNLYFIDKQENEIPIYNLHIHSKDLNLFKCTWNKYLNKYIQIEGVKSRYIRINPLILIQLLKENIKQRTLIRFLLHIPILARTRKLVSKQMKFLNK
jgi:hypothetical protein